MQESLVSKDIRLPKRFRVECAYDGTNFAGWQSQVTKMTVQDTIESRLEVMFEQPVRIHGSGRTDAGVHANGQVFHFDAPWEHGTEALKRALQAGFSHAIQIIEVEEVKEDFHARYGATGKRYVYRLFRGQASPFDVRYSWSFFGEALNVSLMQRAAALLLGLHDFTAFAAKRIDGTKENPVKDLRRLDVIEEGPWLIFKTEASGYLYKMVRSLVGTLVEVGRGKLTIEEVQALLEKKVRTAAVVTAPPQGLFLDKVFYDGSSFNSDSADSSE